MASATTSFRCTCLCHYLSECRPRRSEKNYPRPNSHVNYMQNSVASPASQQIPYPQACPPIGNLISFLSVSFTLWPPPFVLLTLHNPHCCLYITQRVIGNMATLFLLSYFPPLTLVTLFGPLTTPLLSLLLLSMVAALSEVKRNDEGLYYTGLQMNHSPFVLPKSSGASSTVHVQSLLIDVPSFCTWATAPQPRKAKTPQLRKTKMGFRKTERSLKEKNNHSTKDFISTRNQSYSLVTSGSGKGFIGENPLLLDLVVAPCKGKLNISIGLYSCQLPTAQSWD